MIKSQRFDKLLANGNYGTRTEVKKLLKSGRVKVWGVVEKQANRLIEAPFDCIEVDGQRFVYKEFIYIMMNKPQGYVSAVIDNFDKTVFDILPDKYKSKNLFPAGRLDKDTEGLLLITDDGALSHYMLSPKHHVPKSYFAKVDGLVCEKDKEAFLSGVTINNSYKCMPAKLEILKSASESEILLTIHEGKFHQVKKMFEAVDKKVVYLKRISMGGVNLDESLKLGEIRELTTSEVKLLTENTEEE